METGTTVSGETMEDVLRDLGFEPRIGAWWKGIGSKEMCVKDHKPRLTAQSGKVWSAEIGAKYGSVDSPAHLRRIVAAEVACAAAWRGEGIERVDHLPDVGK